CPSAPRASRAGTGSAPAWSSWQPSVGRLDRVQPGLETAHRLAGERVRRHVDPGAGAGPFHICNRERLPDDEAAVPDRERVAVESAHRRPGDAVPLRVVLASVAGAAESGGVDGEPPGAAEVAHLLVLDGAVGLDGAAEVDTVVREDREAGLVAEKAVVADERGPPRDVAFCARREGRDHELALGVAVDGPEVVV